MLLALGGEDRRVPTSQGIKYYRTLRAAGKDVRFVKKYARSLSLHCSLFFFSLNLGCSGIQRTVTLLVRWTQMRIYS